MSNCLCSSKRMRFYSVVLVIMLACRGATAQEAREEFEGWNLEPSLGQAHLVMVARVIRISRVTVVEGAKTEVALREYRFQPVRRLKGIFQRDELSMTGPDLGLAAEDASSAPPLKEGEFRLLILTQQRGFSSFGGAPSYGCVSAAPGATTFGERVPLLTGPDDPLVAVVERLIRVADSSSRRERATLLVDRLADADGVSAVPLLTSLRLRADWAAADERSLTSLARLARKPQPVVRGAAVEVLRELLASRNLPKDTAPFDSVSEALREILNSDEAVTRVRAAALEALGHLLALKAETDWAREVLIEQLTRAATYDERAAAVTALSRIAEREATAAVHDALAALPLDEPPARETVYVRAAVRLDKSEAERILLKRIERSIAARQSLEAEVEQLARMRSSGALPLLLTAAQLDMPAAERYHVAQALGALADDRAVPLLIDWLRGDDFHLKGLALAALEHIDSELAAREARPLLKTEAHLPYKLRLARLLARHGFADGYALATEHLADADHTAAATLVLAALDDPRTADDLSEIVASMPDRRWYAATLTGLAATGNADARTQLQNILANDRSPLAADAADAVGLVGDGELLAPLAKLVQSRNKQIARSSLRALRQHLSGVRTSPRGLAATEHASANGERGQSQPASDVPEPARAEIAEAVASLASDAYVDADVRLEAFHVARLLGGDRYTELLSELADQAELEGTPLLAAVQAQRRRSPERVE
jgi:HEAT repeat protein